MPRLNQVCGSRGSSFWAFSSCAIPSATSPARAADARKISGDVASSMRYIQEAEFAKALRLSLSGSCEKKIINILEKFLAHHLEYSIFLEAPGEARIF